MAVPPQFLGSMTLKALLEDPNLKNPPIIGTTNDPSKLKKDDDLPQFNYGSAFLGPNLWDSTIDNFNLEYMDLDEFLSENGIPVAGDNVVKGPNNTEDDPSDDAVSLPPLQSPSPGHFLKTPPLSPSQFLKRQPPTQSYPAISQVAAVIASKSPSPPASPFNVEFQVSQQDLALTTIPDYGEDSSSQYVPKWKAWTEESRKKNGSEEFDPRKRNFTDDELKPQPIIKKSKKIFVPEDLKDDKYWSRRHKNNYAAKRSRDARRVKENQIALRAAFLEKENTCLREEMNKLRKENTKLKSKLSKYEGPSTDDNVSP